MRFIIVIERVFHLCGMVWHFIQKEKVFFYIHKNNKIKKISRLEFIFIIIISLRTKKTTKHLLMHAYRIRLLNAVIMKIIFPSVPATEEVAAINEK